VAALPVPVAASRRQVEEITALSRFLAIDREDSNRRPWSHGKIRTANRFVAIVPENSGRHPWSRWKNPYAAATAYQIASRPSIPKKAPAARGRTEKCT
jgi:hypothetical protein